MEFLRDSFGHSFDFSGLTCLFQANQFGAQNVEGVVESFSDLSETPANMLRFKRDASGRPAEVRSASDVADSAALHQVRCAAFSHGAGSGAHLRAGRAQAFTGGSEAFQGLANISERKRIMGALSALAATREMLFRRLRTSRIRSRAYPPAETRTLLVRMTSSASSTVQSVMAASAFARLSNAVYLPRARTCRTCASNAIVRVAPYGR